MCVFFKQKTAYEMRISDWSSDVCSSDLFDQGAGRDDSIGADAYMVADQCTELVRIRREPLSLSPAVYAFVLPFIAGVGDNAASLRIHRTADDAVADEIEMRQLDRKSVV